MDLIARLHHFLLEIEEDLGEAGLLLREREDGLVDHLQAESSADAFALRVGDVEADARVGAGLVDGGIGGGLDLQLIGRLDEEEAMVGDRLRVAAKEIGVDVERARHVWRGVQCELRLAVLEIDVAREDGLAVLDDIDVRGAAGARGEDLELNAVAGLDDGAVGAQKNLVRARAGLREEYCWRRGCRDDRWPRRSGHSSAGAGIEADDSDAAAVSGDLLLVAIQAGEP